MAKKGSTMAFKITQTKIACLMKRMKKKLTERSAYESTRAPSSKKTWLSYLRIYKTSKRRSNHNNPVFKLKGVAKSLSQIATQALIKKYLGNRRRLSIAI